MSDNELPLVQTALDGLMGTNSGGNVYVIPAIFLQYKSDLEFTDAVITGTMLTLDVVTIAASGPVALGSKIPMIRRIWALAEVTGAVANIGVNTQVITNPTVVEATNYFNLAIGIVGIKNAGKGVISVAKNIPDAALGLIAKNQSLRNHFVEIYTQWIMRVKKLNIDDLNDLSKLSSEDRKILQSQDDFFRLMEVPEAKTISWEQAIKGGKGASQADLIGKLIKNGNKIEYTNPAGKIIKWSEQSSKDIQNSIEVAKKLDIKDANNIGRITEAKVGDFVMKRKELTGFGQKLNPSITDFDVATLDEIIEVKASFSSVKENQFDKLLDSRLDNFCNPNRKNVILYIDAFLDKATTAQLNMINRIKAKGVTVVYTLDELGKILK